MFGEFCPDGFWEWLPPDRKSEAGGIDIDGGALKAGASLEEEEVVEAVAIVEVDEDDDEEVGI